MDADQKLLDDYKAHEEARIVAEREQRKLESDRYTAAAIAAHKVRQTARLIHNCSVPPWDDLALSSQQHLIEDAKAVAMNPSITAAQLTELYQERLRAWGDTESPDLLQPDDVANVIEELVLKQLKSTLGHP